MTIIRFTADDFNAIVKACKAFVAKTDSHAIGANYLHLYCDGKKVEATALNGIKAIKMTVVALDGNTEGYIALPVPKPVKAKDTPYVTLSSEGDTVTIDTATGSQIIRLDKPAPNGAAREIVARFFSKNVPQAQFYFDPKQLADTLAAFDCGCVRIDYFDPLKPLEIWGRMDNGTALHAVALPMRPFSLKLTEMRED